MRCGNGGGRAGAAGRRRGQEVYAPRCRASRNWRGGSLQLGRAAGKPSLQPARRICSSPSPAPRPATPTCTPSGWMEPPARGAPRGRPSAPLPPAGPVEVACYRPGGEGRPDRWGLDTQRLGGSVEYWGAGGCDEEDDEHDDDFFPSGSGPPRSTHPPTPVCLCC